MAAGVQSTMLANQAQTALSGQGMVHGHARS